MGEIAAYIPTLFDLYAMVNGRWVMWSLVLIAVLLIAVIFLMSLIRKSRSKINQLSDDLSQLTSDKNRLKEQKQGSQVVADHQLVTALFSICFQLLSEKRALLKNAIESLEKGHSEELLDRLSKDDRNNVDIKHYNLLMDSMFVKIYPDFVDKFCALLNDGDSLRPKNGEILSPELRVFALIRMNILDSGFIASVSNYSPNTIYNYRAKVKNMAKVDRDDFENIIKTL